MNTNMNTTGNTTAANENVVNHNTNPGNATTGNHLAALTTNTERTNTMNTVATANLAPFDYGCGVTDKKMNALMNDARLLSAAHLPKPKRVKRDLGIRSKGCPTFNEPWIQRMFEGLKKAKIDSICLLRTGGNYSATEFAELFLSVSKAVEHINAHTNITCHLSTVPANGREGHDIAVHKTNTRWGARGANMPSNTTETGLDSIVTATESGEANVAAPHSAFEGEEAIPEAIVKTPSGHYVKPKIIGAAVLANHRTPIHNETGGINHSPLNN